MNCKNMIYEILHQIVNNIESIDDFSDLYDEFKLSSLDVVEIIVRIEESFGIEIDDYDLDLDNFRTVNSMVLLVERRLDKSNEF